MEQIINVSGKEYNVASDTELTSQQMTDVVRQIEKMSCGSCGGSSIKTLTANCAGRTYAKAGETVKMTLGTKDGTPPYTIKFYKNDIEITTPPCTKTNQPAGTYTCNYVVSTTDTTTMTFKGEVTDSKTNTCSEVCSVLKRVSPPCGVYGDVDSDGYITATDAIWIQEYIDNKRTFTPEQIKRADVNADGVVDTSDIMTILNYISAGTGTFPVCKLLPSCDFKIE